MTKDEMKNRISMALKDPILQQGFEIICKNLAELEKENEKLKKRLSVLLSCKNCPDNKGGFICQKEYEDKCLTQKIQYSKELKEENTELEKENAELKNQVSFLDDNLRVARKDRENLQLDVAKGLKEFVKDYPATSLRYLANEKYVEQLTKAKELLKKIEKIVYSGENEIKRLSKIVDILAEAEQFLNSEVCKCL